MSGASSVPSATPSSATATTASPERFGRPPPRRSCRRHRPAARLVIGGLVVLERSPRRRSAGPGWPGVIGADRLVVVRTDRLRAGNGGRLPACRAMAMGSDSLSSRPKNVSTSSPVRHDGRLDRGDFPLDRGVVLLQVTLELALASRDQRWRSSLIRSISPVAQASTPLMSRSASSRYSSVWATPSAPADRVDVRLAPFPRAASATRARCAPARWPAWRGRGRPGRPIRQLPFRRTDVADRAVKAMADAPPLRDARWLSGARTDPRRPGFWPNGHPVASHLQPAHAFRAPSVQSRGGGVMVLRWIGGGKGAVRWDRVGGARSWCRSGSGMRRRHAAVGISGAMKARDDEDQDDLHPREASRAVHPPMPAAAAALMAVWRPRRDLNLGPSSLEGGCSVHFELPGRGTGGSTLAARPGWPRYLLTP